MIKLGKRTLAVTAAVLAAGGLAFGVSAGTAHAGTVYSQNGTYQFASNEGASGTFVVSDTALTYPDASQALGATGVTLSASGTSGESSAVIVALGRLNTMFNADGVFVPPAVTGSGPLQYNLYFDTNGDDTYFGFKTSPFVFSSYDGDNAAAMGSALAPAGTTPDFGTFSSQPTTVPNLTTASNMDAVKQDYTANPDYDADPLVWAWIGINAGTGGAPASAVVTSVDGHSLVTATTTAAPVVTSHGHATAVAPTRENVYWDQSRPSWVRLTIVGDGPINGHVSYVNVTGATGEGVYTGLAAGHTGTVTLQPESSRGGAADGPSGKIVFVTER